MRILHISDTTLSGAPYRLAHCQNKYTENEARHLVWKRSVLSRYFPVDLVGEEMGKHRLREIWSWADVIHWHNRAKRSIFVQQTGVDPKNKSGVLQIHSPRNSERFQDEFDLNFPLLVVGQYQPRQWQDTEHTPVPNVLDIFDERLMPKTFDKTEKGYKGIPIVTYAPSNCQAKGWDDKGYAEIAPVLKRLKFNHTIDYRLIFKQPFEKAIEMKQMSDIGVEELVTGSYHLSALEYASMGIPTFAYLDEKTQETLAELTGSSDNPWLPCRPGELKKKILKLVNSPEKRKQEGKAAREWMEYYWDPRELLKHYTNVYETL